MSDDFELLKLGAEFLERNKAQISALSDSVFGAARNSSRLYIPNIYKKYIDNAIIKYGKSKSFFIRSEPVNIYDFYVPLSLTLGVKKFPKVAFGDFASTYRRSVISGVAGIGKSILMRHLFLSAIKDGDKVPVFVDLRNANNGEKSLQDLIMDSLELNGFKANSGYIEKAIQKGHFALLLDGYDEISYSRREVLAKQISRISAKSKDSIIIISSRPDDVFSGWQDFSVFDVSSLSLDEAVELVVRLPYEEKEIKDKFVHELREKLYDSHKSFLSNPLLLSIMLLTYGMNADIPTKINLFYNQAYEALFQRHDALKEGFRRERRTMLDIQDFARVFSLFCLQTYDQRIFQFSRSDALSYLEKMSLAIDVQYEPSSFLEDAQQSVCLLVEDGLFLVFAHRSFQEYFVAKYINDSPPRVQEELIERFHAEVNGDSVFSILFEMNQELVERMFVIPYMKNIFKELGVKTRPGITHYFKYLKKQFSEICCHGRTSLAVKFASHNASFHDILFFSIYRCGTEEEKGYVFSSRDKEEDFVKKHFPGDDSCFSLNDLSYRSEFIRDLSDTDGWLSIKALEIGFSILERLEKKHRASKKALAKLLV